MALTDEQRLRIETNRRAALEKLKRKREQRSSRTCLDDNNVFEAGGFVEDKPATSANKTAHGGRNGETNHNKRRKSHHGTGKDNPQQLRTAPDDDDESVEEWELSASEYITRSEAQKSYCVPDGTLQVCSFIERDNPKHRGWAMMKLYNRAEVRRRGRKRFGGKQGLIIEREKRKAKRNDKDAELTDIFR
mmetsp:Transcript_4006/g.8935  ORF Transcript_4006/g.8935 Transcript_4006/m.8935 type:complete len:190 (-) Transcript_4006:633-1202(-)